MIGRVKIVAMILIAVPSIFVTMSITPSLTYALDTIGLQRMCLRFGDRTGFRINDSVSVRCDQIPLLKRLNVSSLGVVAPIDGALKCGDFDGLENLSELSILGLSEGLPDCLFRSFRGLISLRIGARDFRFGDEVGVSLNNKLLKPLTELSELQLINVHLSEPSLVFLSRPEKLRKLLIWSYELKRQWLDALARVPNLTHLDLGDFDGGFTEGITGLSSDLCKRLPKLESIALRLKHLRFIADGTFSNCRQLGRIQFEGVPLDLTGKGAFRGLGTDVSILGLPPDFDNGPSDDWGQK